MKVIPKRRIMEGKTDYTARKLFLKAGKPRVVFRKTNKYITGQVTASSGAQDRIVASVNSKELLNHGWPKEWSGSLKSMPASYLSGYVLGSRALTCGIDSAILDIGLNRNVPKSRIYAFVKGAIEAGLKIPCSEKVLPEKSRIEGMHMKKDIKNVIDKVNAKFKGKK
ncbi:50S ribosomal protein L18 [Candidatus Pacearchaeota archaeon]|nr:50S ribosomal protein L18 [Candidatus Pacearchaeota archaeon]